MSTEQREPFPYFRAAAVMVVGLVVVGGLKVRDALRRIWREAG